MRLQRLAFLTFAFILFCSIGFAQTTDPTATPQPSDPSADVDAAKKQKELNERIMSMLDQAVADGNSLRLPQNKALIFAIAGDLYWKFDEKRARELFRSAATEIINYNTETDREQAQAAQAAGARGNFQPPDQDDPRPQVLPLVAAHDAELAYQMLLQTRTAKLAAAMLKSGQPDAAAQQNGRGGGGGPGGGRGNFNVDAQSVAQEVALEQQFALLAAQNDPDAAIKLIKDSLSKGISSNVLPALQTLYKSDDKKAGDLAGDVVGNLTGTDLTQNTQDINVALNFLQYATQPPPAATSGTTPAKQFNFTDSQTKDLANKLVNTFTGATPTAQMANMINRAIPTLQKVVPEKIPLLTQKVADIQKAAPANGRGGAAQLQQQAQRQFDRTASPEDILAQIPKMTNDADKRAAYQSVGNKAAQLTDEARAQKLIDQIPDDTARAAAQKQLDTAKIARSANSGKLEDARKLIGLLTDPKTRLQKTVALAIQFQALGTEKDIASAKSLMKDARNMIKDVADDEDELADVMEVVRGYAVIDPENAFHLAEPVFDQMNDLIQASAVLSKFNKRDRTFKKGELVLKMNGSGGGGGGFGPGGGFGGGGFGGANSILLFRYIPQIQMLGKADLNRMSQASDRFTRADIRTLVKLFVLQGFLKVDPKPAAPAAAPAAPPAPGADTNQ